MVNGNVKMNIKRCNRCSLWNLRTWVLKRNQQRFYGVVVADDTSLSDPSGYAPTSCKWLFKEDVLIEPNSAHTISSEITLVRKLYLSATEEVSVNKISGTSSADVETSGFRWASADNY